MTDYEHVPSPACHGRGHIRVEEAAKIAGVSIEEARRRARRCLGLRISTSAPAASQLHPRCTATGTVQPGSCTHDAILAGARTPREPPARRASPCRPGKDGAPT